MRSRLSSLFPLLLACALVLAGCDSSDDEGMNQAPTAEITVESQDGLNVSLSAANSSDPDGSIESYSWEFGDGDTGSGETVSHDYAEVGSYTVTLTVTDNSDETATTSVDVTAGTLFDVTISNVGDVTPVTKSGVFNTPRTATGPRAIEPGESYQFSFTAGPQEIPGTGTVMSFATMFIQSNDKYYAFAPGGVPLYDENGNPVGSGGSPANLTDQVNMYDAGTEQDQEPGNGSNQPGSQSGPDTGPDDANSVVLVENTDNDPALEDDGFEYPPVGDVIDVRVESAQDDASGSIEFTVTIENVSATSGATANGTPITLSPGSYAVHFDQTPGGDDVTYPAHTPGEDTNGSGIERIAEDGSPGTHAQMLGAVTGVTVPFSPGAYAAHSDQVQIFQVGESATTGVERIAEDGNPAPLVQGLSGTSGITDGGAFSTPDGASESGPIGPGGSYSFTVGAVEGDVLSIGTMYIQSNDLFYAFAPGGVPLYDSNGDPIEGDITGELNLYDAGTEVDQEPGTGLDQAPRQADADTGAEEQGGNIVEVEDSNGNSFPDDDGFEYAVRDSIIQVTIQPQGGN
jgi:hypothetical protein